MPDVAVDEISLISEGEIVSGFRSLAHEGWNL
jgi:hypothetical protein